jgi:uncharacterized protein YkwD
MVRRFPLAVVAAVLIAGTVVAASIVQAANAPIMGAALPGEAAARLQVPSAGQAPTTEEEKMARLLVEQINAERATHGLAAYQFDAAAAAAAATHSADQATRRTMTHAGSDGSNAGQRLTKIGVSWGTWAENVGAGFNDPATILQAWLDSASHGPVVLSTSFTRVGAGVATSTDGARYWTMIAVG